jgi:YD repeat-containing protein
MMNDTAQAIRTVVVEREFPYPAEKLWRALTQPHLIEAWLMKSDFMPEAGRHFTFTADWGSVDCEVTEIDPGKTLAYTWNAHGLVSVVTWTLEPTGKGTQLQMAQSGFRQDQEQAYQGAKYGWQNFFNQLEQLMAKEAA